MENIEQNTEKISSQPSEMKDEVVEETPQKNVNEEQVPQQIISEEKEEIPAVRSQILCVKEVKPTEADSNFLEEENSTEENLIQEDRSMTLVSVKGNNKVLRCTECNSFVSKNKPHTKTKCREIAAKFKANRGKRGKSSKNRKSKSIERKLRKVIEQKRFKKLPKNLRDVFKKILE